MQLFGLCALAALALAAPAPGRKLLESTKCFCITDFDGTLTKLNIPEYLAQPQAAQALAICKGPNFVPMMLGVATGNNTAPVQQELTQLYPSIYSGESSSYFKTGINGTKTQAYKDLIAMSGSTASCTLVFDRKAARSSDAQAAGVTAFVNTSPDTGLTTANVNSARGMTGAGCACKA